MTGHATARDAAVDCAVHALLVAVLFADVLFLGRLPYLRDVATFYYPNDVFTAAALRGGTWPLWNHTADAGAPFLMAYPVQLLMLAVLGARRTLALSPPLHVWLAMCGTAFLARQLGWSRRGAWLSGAVFGLSGLLLSSLSLGPLAQAASWAPLLAAAFLRCLARPSGRSAALLGVVAAIQASTLAAEVAMQTALCALVLAPALPGRRHWRSLGAAAAVAAGLAAPAVLGTRALLEGSARAAGFDPSQVLKWSAHPVVLGEMVWPRLLGDPHTMTNLGYWGQPYFPDGAPYFVSLYLGPLVLALALCSGGRGRRLWVLAAIGMLLALGAHGPLGGVLAAVLPSFRSPVKYAFLTTLALALLAGLGVEAAANERRSLATWCLGAAGALFLSIGIALSLAPQPTARAAASVWPRLAAPEAEPVARTWPPALLQTGGLAGLAAAALWAGRRAGLAPAACLVADLLATNARVEPSAPGDFYDLRPEVLALVQSAASPVPSRWFTYGIVNSPGVTWAPALLRRNEDVWLHYMDRQTLWGRTSGLDGLESALDEDRTGWAPPGATLSGGESTPAMHRRNHPRLRMAGVRWILSFLPLPEDLALPRGEAHLPEIVQPLVLHELRDALPRAFWVPDCEVLDSAEAVRARVADPSFDPRQRVLLDAPPPGRHCGAGAGAGASEVKWRRLGPHAVEIEAAADEGWLVFLEGYHRDWRVDAHPDVPLLRADARYWALPVGAGHVLHRVRYRPAWLWPSLALATLGGLLAFALCLRPARKLDTSSSVALASGD